MLFRRVYTCLHCFPLPCIYEFAFPLPKTISFMLPVQLHFCCRKPNDFHVLKCSKADVALKVKYC
jgi:hypothetical protein